MILNIIFAFSGLIIAVLIGAKMWEEKHRRKPLFLRLVSLGDEHARHLSHELAHKYSEWKEQAHFFINKQLPLHTKNFINKTNTTVKERLDKHIGDIRGSRFLKRSDGISEFFKSLEEKENGRIDDSIESSDSQNEDKKVE
jgi:hypothetical protein